MATTQSSRSSSCSSDSRDSHLSSATRATTPDSVPPSRHIICLTSPSVNGLKALFEAASMSSVLGLCLFTKANDGNESAARAFISKYLDNPTPHWSSGSLRGISYIQCVAPPTLEYTSVRTVVPAHEALFSACGLRTIVAVTSQDRRYIHYLLERPPVVFPPLADTPSLSLASSSSSDVNNNIPTLEEWKTLWSMWDLITLEMIPQEMLHQKPIDLRHKCLFYIGHIPTFLDMLIVKAIGGKASEPAFFWNIFERGIDPHVDDPDHCHNHSEVPEKDEDWPTLETILQFRDNVRERLTKLYEELHSGKRQLTRTIARMLVMCIEHEGWHVETLLYMLFQRGGKGTLPPTGFTTPRWQLLRTQWEQAPVPASKIVIVGPDTVTLGHDDSEGDDNMVADVDANQPSVLEHTYGWDNESPVREFQVKKFKAEWRPVTNGEFLEFLVAQGGGDAMVPKSWIEQNGEYKVQTIYGPVDMEVARLWPVLTSYDDLETYAKSKGGRLPTEAELRLFLDTFDVGHEGGANIGFRNWHPIPATMGLEGNGGKGSNGGIWEWTSTDFSGHEGLVPTKLFTGYSTDFFDEKHRVVLGGSYATIPRLAGRRTVRNFYQHNYPYPWVGARVVYDFE